MINYCMRYYNCKFCPKYSECGSDKLIIEIIGKIDSWNEYIQKERSNKFWANKIKQQEKELVRYQTIGKKYTGKYPIKLTITKYFKDKRQDLDNTRIKGLIDGLVESNVIKNDNLNHIINIELRAKFGEEDRTLIEIEEEKVL